MKNHLVEFIGTFFLVLTAGMTVIACARAAGHRRRAMVMVNASSDALCGGSKSLAARS
jgi:glycerol uptake facilitator-like aquaporin